MVQGLLGRKVGMTQIFADDGRVVPVTVIEAGPCYVTQLRTKERDGYEAVQIGFGATRRLNGPENGHLARAKTPLVSHLRELRADGLEGVEIGQKLDASLFKVGDLVDVVGTSKGKGFAGVDIEIKL